MIGILVGGYIRREKKNWLRLERTYWLVAGHDHICEISLIEMLVGYSC